MTTADADRLVADLRDTGAIAGDLVAVALRPGAGLGLAHRDRTWAFAGGNLGALVAAVESGVQPRWVWWDHATPAALVAAGVRIARCWDVAAVYRLYTGRWRADPARVWAELHSLPTDWLPAMGQLDLLSDDGDSGTDLGDPIRPDGHLRPEWTSGGWWADADRLARWAATALTAATMQEKRLEGDRAHRTAHSESVAELLCAELEADGLPVSLEIAEAIIAKSAGPRPHSDEEAAQHRHQRDAAVLQHALTDYGVDLRNPAHVRTMLARAGVDVDDTRAWRLERLRDSSPLVDALLTWRKAERIATTYGYTWLDEKVGPDGRLRGGWTGSDGAAGRMTAQAGLHNMPAELRPAVVAEPGHLLVRADLGQIEPRVLAAISGDPALVAATAADDLYAPVASKLGVERPTAKVAVLAAMYGQVSGTAGQALRDLKAAYPVAMRFLDDADDDGRAGQRHPHLRRPPGAHVVRRRCRGDRRTRPLCPQRRGPGCGGRAVQGVGRDGAGAHGTPRGADRALPARRTARPRAHRTCRRGR